MLIRHSLNAYFDLLLEILGLTKSFGGLLAVKDLSFRIEQGEIVGLIGPNGAGKTTVFNIMTGVYRPNSGKILFKSENMVGLTSNQICRKGICRTFQIVKPFNRMTVFQSVLAGVIFGRGGGDGDPKDQCSRILEMMGLNDKSQYACSKLTLVDKKRVEIGRAVATRPELLLLDEVMAGLNPSEVEKALQLVRSINESGITILMVEHIMQAIMQISDRIVVLNYGEKISEGSPKEVAQNKAVIDAYLGDSYA